MRIRKSFNDNWKFRKLPENADEMEWVCIDLPHTWNDKDGCGGKKGEGEYAEGYYRGMGEYRKEFSFSSDIFENKEVFIEFEGANTVAELFVNGVYAGIHEGGYSAFRFDITDKILIDKNNIIKII